MILELLGGLVPLQKLYCVFSLVHVHCHLWQWQQQFCMCNSSHLTAFIHATMRNSYTIMLTSTDLQQIFYLSSIFITHHNSFVYMSLYCYASIYHHLLFDCFIDFVYLCMQNNKDTDDDANEDIAVEFDYRGSSLSSICETVVNNITK